MGKTITGMRDSLRLDLKDTSALARWSDAELDRCVERAVADLSRFLPMEKSYEITIDYDVTSESFTTPADADPDYFVDNVTLDGEVAGGTLSLANISVTNPGPVTFLLTDDNNSITSLTIVVKGTNRAGNYIEESFHLSGGKSQTGKKEFKTVMQVIVGYINGSASAADVVDIGTTNPYDVWVQLANKPIRPKSESITSYTRDTDYIMDYANGRVKFTDAGSMAANTAYTLASYDKSRVEIDLTPIKHELIRVDRLIYPADVIPQTFVGVDAWAGILTLGGGVTSSQEEMSNDQHAVIRYLAQHTPPSVDAPGSYPDFLDNTVVLAASAYALFIKATQYEHAAAASLDNVSTFLNNNSGDDAAAILADITDNASELRDAIRAALECANNYLDEVDDSDFALTTYGAEALIETGSAKINTVNIGDRVPENYREYAQTCIARAQARVAAATGFLGEASARLTDIRAYIDESAGWASIAEGFVTEAAALMALADKFRTEAIERRNEAWSIWRDPKQYMGDFSLTLLTQPGKYK